MHRDKLKPVVHGSTSQNLSAGMAKYAITEGDDDLAAVEDVADKFDSTVASPTSPETLQ